MTHIEEELVVGTVFSQVGGGPRYTKTGQSPQSDGFSILRPNKFEEERKIHYNIIISMDVLLNIRNLLY